MLQIRRPRILPRYDADWNNIIGLDDFVYGIVAEGYYSDAVVRCQRKKICLPEVTGNAAFDSFDRIGDFRDGGTFYYQTEISRNYHLDGEDPEISVEQCDGINSIVLDQEICCSGHTYYSTNYYNHETGESAETYGTVCGYDSWTPEYEVSARGPKDHIYRENIEMAVRNVTFRET